MPINDLHIHLPPSPSMEMEMEISSHAPEPLFTELSRKVAEAGVEKAMAIILDAKALRNETFVKFLGEIKRQRKYANLFLSCALDFRAPDSLKLVELAADLGFRSLKFQPYEQEIDLSDYDDISRLAKRADELGLFIIVCCAFGTTRLYDHSGIRLACHLSELVKCPVVMAHGGGALVLDAVCAALDVPNIYLDLSFSLPFFMGSSVEGDFAFAIRKLGSPRWAFGSDAPNIGLEEAISTTVNFLKKYRFSDADIDNVMFQTANKLLVA